MRDGRVRKSEPFWASSERSKGGIGPEDWPKETSIPMGRRQSRDFMKVAWPTES